MRVVFRIYNDEAVSFGYTVSGLDGWLRRGTGYRDANDAKIHFVAADFVLGVWNREPRRGHGPVAAAASWFWGRGRGSAV